ncbi:MAG: hypothetical protein JWR80_6189 [Bradyrhizobium sp.]|nr:hypothetical protein [Bradyrhizobium sp.]
MRFFACAAAFLAFLSLGATPGFATDSVNGRWAAEPASCWGDGNSPAQSPFVVSSYAVRWLGDTCRVGRMYKTGETLHLQALCWGAEGERTIPVSMTPHGGKLAVVWNRGAHGNLQRCP